MAMKIFFYPRLSQKKPRFAGSFSQPKLLLLLNRRMWRREIYFAWLNDEAINGFHSHKSATAIYICALVITLFGIFA